MRVLVDGENLDCTLGNILKRAPRWKDRPQWQKVITFVQTTFAKDVAAIFYLVKREAPGFNGFVSVLHDLGIKPVILLPKPGVSVVDEAILATLPHVPPHDDVLLASHDGVYARHLERLVGGERRVAVLGFRERLSHLYTAISDIEILDIEHDADAFMHPLPREPIAGVDLSEFNPRSLMVSHGRRSDV